MRHKKYIFLFLFAYQALYAMYPYPTINTGGFYRLASNVTNQQIVIAASNVSLDLNECTVSGGTNGLVINSGLSNVSIKNGTVRNVTNDGVQINAGCSNITLDSLTVQSAQRGIFVSNVTDGLIRNCELLSSNTGLEINTCHNIMLQSCVAQANKYAGFSLVTSTTCSLLDCKSISTGQGNTDLFGAIYGFVNNRGQGNMFERCVANATQGLSMTASDGIVAGFALLGTGTQCHTIINCEAGNSLTSPAGFAEPYGIYLGKTLVTQTLGGVGPTSDNYTGLDVAWSSDGAYFAVAGDNLSLYSFDRTSTLALRVATAAIASRSLDWHPQADSIAVGSVAGTVVLYTFDRLNNQLTQANTQTASANVEGVAWRPDGKYVMTANRGSTNLNLYYYDEIRQVLNRTQIFVMTGGATSVSWSPTGQYVALTNNTTLTINFFNNGTIFQVASVTSGASDTGGKISWSSEGNYIAIIGGATSPVIRVYQFTAPSTLTLKDTQTLGATGSLNDMSLEWSPDSNYLLATNNGGAQSLLYSFDKGAGKLTLLSTLSYTTLFSAGTVNGCAWAPDGGYIAITGAGTSGFPSVYLLNGIQFPVGNTIINNKVYSSSGGAFFTGTGIYGSSVTNLMVGNTSFNNPYNFLFVQNSFNQSYGEGPSPLQSSGATQSVPILTPIDIPQTVDRIRFLVQSLVDDLI